MMWTKKSIPNQDGRIALITGANSGLGFDTAKALFTKGADLILGCRSIEKAEKARQKLLNEPGCGDIMLLELDLSDLTKVNKAADLLSSRHKKIDLLINNAGIMAPPLTLSKQGIELQFAVNHLSHMALTLKLLPQLAKAIGGRVVTVSSGAQYMGKINSNDIQSNKNYDRWSSYSQSKLANVMFALELAKKLQHTNISVSSLSAHPGLARTNLQSTSIAANGSWQEEIAYKLMHPLFQSSDMGALPQLRAATDPNAKNGEQYGPRLNFRGFPKLCSIAPSALNKIERENVWELSIELIEKVFELNQAKELLSIS